jgi:protein-tyrosine phosphatase
MAETVLRIYLAAAGLGDAVVLDSAGTGDWHLGERIYPPAHEALAGRGYDGSAHRSRQIQPSWLAGRDLVLAMDRRNLANLRRMAGARDRDRIRLYGEVGGLSGHQGLEGAEGAEGAGGAEIPDPYGGSPDEFGHVLDLLTAAAPVIVARLAELLRPEGTTRARPAGSGIPSSSADGP